MNNEIKENNEIRIYIYIYIYIYQNGKELKPSYQVLRVLCKRVLQFSACI